MKDAPRWTSALGAVAILAFAGGFGVLALNQESAHTTAANQGFSIVAKQTTNPVKAIDTNAVIKDANWFTLAYAKGVRLYVLLTSITPDCKPWDRAQEQIKLALSAGIDFAAYTTDTKCWRNGIESVGVYKNQMQFFAIDTNNAITRETIDGIKSTGVRPVIRTGSTSWTKSMGGSTSFSDVMMWESGTSVPVSLASWTPNLDRPAPVEFGGWNCTDNSRIAVQQGTNVNLNNVVVNLDVVDASYLR